MINYEAKSDKDLLAMRKAFISAIENEPNDADKRHDLLMEALPVAKELDTREAKWYSLIEDNRYSEMFPQYIDKTRDDYNEWVGERRVIALEKRGND